MRNATLVFLPLAAIVAAGYMLWSHETPAIGALEEGMALGASEAASAISKPEVAMVRKPNGQGVAPAPLSALQESTPPSQELASELGPLERLLEDSRAESLETQLSLLLDQDRNVAQRVTAANFVLTEAIAIHLELAGTAINPRKEGDDTPLPAKFQFFKGGRLYCFEESEFPVWGECKAYLFSGTPDELGDTFVQEVATMGKDALASIRE